MKSKEMFAGFSVAAGGDRFGEHIILGGPQGEPIDCKVSGKDTDGAMCVFEFNCHGGGPNHLHHDQDEWIYIIEGEFEFQIGGKERHREHVQPGRGVELKQQSGENEKLRQFRLGAGESIFLPRKVAHVWARAGGKPGKIINVYQPAGKMEEFFREVGKYDGKPAIHEALGVEGLRKLFDKYGMHLLGPPLHWEEGNP